MPFPTLRYLADPGIKFTSLASPAPSTFPRIRVFSNELALCIRWPKYCSFTFRISPSNKYSGLISFKIDWFELLAVQGTFRTLLQYHSLKESIPQHSAFFTDQLSQPFMITGEIVALTIRTFVSRVTSLLFNTLSRFVIAFLPRSNRLLISWLRSLSAEILEAKKRKYVTVSTFFPSISHAIMGSDATISVFFNS